MGTTLNRTADNLSPWFDDVSPFHLALVWLRLGEAESFVHHATGELHHDVIKQIAVLRDEAWSKLYDRTTNDQRVAELAHAKAYLAEHGS